MTQEQMVGARTDKRSPATLTLCEFLLV